MKTLIAALILGVAVPSAALAQEGAAAGRIPNTFDNPGAAQAVPPPAPEPRSVSGAEIGPDVKRSEDALRAVVAQAQGEGLDYAMFSDSLAQRIRGQAAQIVPIIKGFGELQEVIYVGQEQGADLFALDFAQARTQWVIGFNAEDQIAVLLFRPAPAEPAAPSHDH